MVLLPIFIVALSTAGYSKAAVGVKNSGLLANVDAVLSQHKNATSKNRVGTNHKDVMLSGSNRQMPWVHTLFTDGTLKWDNLLSLSSPRERRPTSTTVCRCTSTILRFLRSAEMGNGR